MYLKEKTIEKRVIYKGRILNLRTDTVELTNGKTAYREMIEHSGGAGIIAINDKNEIYLIKQYRYPYDEVLYEIPAGKISPGEEPEKCAERELTEETGLIAGKMTLLNTVYPSPGYTDEKLYIYYAENLSKGAANPDEDEFLEIISVPFEQALDMVNKGIIKDCKTVIAIYRLACFPPS